MAITIVSTSPPPCLLPMEHRNMVENIDGSVSSTPIGSLKLCKTILEIKQIHAHLTKRGLILSPSPSPMSKLIVAYARTPSSESLDYASKAFEILVGEDHASLFVWNTLIRAYSSCGFLGEGFDLFIRMVDHGLLPDRFTFPPLFAACTKTSAFEEGVQLHAFLIKMGDEGGIGGDLFIDNSLIHLYSEGGDMDSAQRVFDGMSERNVVSWTSLIDGYARGHQPEKAVSLFYDMEKEDGSEPNSVTMACVVSACAKLQDLNLGERIHAFVLDSGIELSTTLVNSLVDLYMKCGAMLVAKQLFDDCVDKNVVLWNTMMSNYVRRGMAREALEIFNEMLLSHLRPDRATIVTVVSACAQLGEAMAGRLLHGYVLRNGFDGWDMVSNSIIDMYMKCGEMNAAFAVFGMAKKKTVVSWNALINGCMRNGDLENAWMHFDMMPERDLVSWNTMISALTKESTFEEALELFRAMQGSDVKPDRVTMVSVSSACGYLGAGDLAKWIYLYIRRKRIPRDVKLDTALVDMFARCGDPESSLQVFKKMTIKDVSAWTAAIGAMSIKGDGKQALELFDHMIAEGVKPDSVVFVGVLNACSHGGLVEEGRRFFKSMTEIHEFAPEIVHYGCLVDMLGRAGLLEEAREFIENLPMEPNDVIWGALLSACRVHQNLELAEYAASKVLALAPHRTGIRVLLSNAYASEGRWQDVAAVRSSLNYNGFRKLPGSSVIEVQGVIHEFTSGDESHPQMTQIAEMLHEMTEKLMVAGYVSDLSNVLVDVGEKEKVHLLSRHSEKVAVAFGLISTGRRVPIRIVKNLRICSDCHSFMKLVSAVYEREIAVRDNKRFHFFRKGSCSCRDFW